MLKYPLNVFEYPHLIFTPNSVKPKNLKKKQNNITETPINDGKFALPVTNQLSQAMTQAWEEKTAYKVTDAKSGAQAVIQQGLKGIAGLDSTVADSVSYSLRKAINPHTEVLYSGPGFRTFNFEWTLQPKSEKEVNQLRNIERALKKYSAPSLGSEKAFGLAMDYFDYPSSWRVEMFIPSNGKSTATPLIKFKRLVIENIESNYTPDSNLVLLKSGWPLSFNLHVTMKEMKWVMREDIEAGF